MNIYIKFWNRQRTYKSLSRFTSIAVKPDADLKAYYVIKVAEGKSKLSVLNAVKNKLLARVITVVNKGEEYLKKPPWIKFGFVIEIIGEGGLYYLQYALICSSASVEPNFFDLLRSVQPPALSLFKIFEMPRYK